MRPTAPSAISIEQAAALHGAGRVDEARAMAEALVRADPRDFNALHLLGTIAVTRGEAEECVGLYERALAIEPRSAEAWCNRGIAWRMLGEPAKALADYDRAVAADPRSFNAHTLRGVLLAALNRHAEAREAYERALAINPRYAPALFNRGSQDLALGRFAAGWDAYELRFATQPPTSVARSFGRPRLGPGDLARARRLAVWREQGLGDQILFSTLLPELRERVEAFVEVDPRLIAALRRSLPEIAFVTPEEAPAAFAKCDFEMPLGSLPWLLRRDAQSFARQPRALLRADPARVAEYAARPGIAGSIAISWRSFQPRQRRLYGEAKSIPLECFARVAATGVRLLDLQYGDVTDERAAFDARHPGARLELDGLDRYDDLEGIFAAIEASQLVITTSNVTAHLAGALGKRTWLVYLAAQPPFHYWAPRDGRSPWYPSVEIVTDPGWTDWGQAFQGLIRKLSPWPDDQGTLSFVK